MALVTAHSRVVGEWAFTGLVLGVYCEGSLEYLGCSTKPVFVDSILVGSCLLVRMSHQSHYSWYLGVTHISEENFARLVLHFSRYDKRSWLWHPIMWRQSHWIQTYWPTILKAIFWCRRIYSELSVDLFVNRFFLDRVLNGFAQTFWVR